MYIIMFNIIMYKDNLAYAMYLLSYLPMCIVRTNATIKNYG